MLILSYIPHPHPLFPLHVNIGEFPYTGWDGIGQHLNSETDSVATVALFVLNSAVCATCEACKSFIKFSLCKSAILSFLASSWAFTPSSSNWHNLSNIACVLDVAFVIISLVLFAFAYLVALAYPLVFGKFS